eukprot:2046-Pleurochrysis_carterae.AAC.1
MSRVASRGACEMAASRSSAARRGRACARARVLLCVCVRECVRALALACDARASLESRSARATASSCFRASADSRSRSMRLAAAAADADRLSICSTARRWPMVNWLTLSSFGSSGCVGGGGGCCSGAGDALIDDMRIASPMAKCVVFIPLRMPTALAARAAAADEAFAALERKKQTSEMADASTSTSTRVS